MAGRLSTHASCLVVAMMGHVAVLSSSGIRSRASTSYTLGKYTALGHCISRNEQHANILRINSSKASAADELTWTPYIPAILGKQPRFHGQFTGRTVLTHLAGTSPTNPSQVKGTSRAHRHRHDTASRGGGKSRVVGKAIDEK
ncbi:hypothetical protein QR685DRAFT_568466 [Neurospora intermedia]|uniref:Secreted protein n=1 Tax=Neurospora intermedia TaxID=5142 RepID=A0ABR3DSS3_NEUIN